MDTNYVDLADARKSYGIAALEQADLLPCPNAQFAKWFENALANKIEEPYVMTLATASKQGRPSARIVLLRKHSTAGFEFYSNYASAKGLDLAENPQAELMFFWGKQEQQIRVYGAIEKLSETESSDYFHLRPRDSQIAAHASCPQSAKVADRQTLDNHFKQLTRQFADFAVIPKPALWGGYRLVPSQFEFWQGRANRMHDRFVYDYSPAGWEISRLMP